MSTNYYLRINECNHCGRYEQIHIGKAGYGMKFVFAGYPQDTPHSHKLIHIPKAKDWFVFLINHRNSIHDEYGEKILFSDFIILVSSLQENKKEVRDKQFYIDENGFQFSSIWFD